MDRRKRAIDAYRKVRDGRSQPSEADDEASRGFEKTADDEPRDRRDEQPVRSPEADRPSGDAPEDKGSGTRDRSAPEAADEAPTAEGAAVTPDLERVGRESAADAAALRERLSGMLEGPGADRAAKLLLALGTERAAQVMRLLDDDQVEAVAAALVRVRALSREEADAVLAHLAAGSTVPPARGGPDVAREILRAAFGEEEGERRFFRSVPNASAHHFAFLNELEPGQLHAAVRDESPAAAALILSHVERGLAAKTLSMLDEEARAAVARRIARMGKLSRDVVVRVEEAVREKIRRTGRQVSEEVDGAATLAAILHHLGPSRSESILGELRDANIDLSETVRRKLYSTELLFDLSDRHLADLLREFSDREISLFLKGKAEALRARVLRALSERRGQSVSDEYAHLGAQRREEVDRVTSEVLERLRELEEDGSILVPREGDRYI
ncbi:MAG: FliG C-terminal domain-containing protein [Spirochaetota bacterium]